MSIKSISRDCLFYIASEMLTDVDIARFAATDRCRSALMEDVRIRAFDKNSFIGKIVIQLSSEEGEVAPQVKATAAALIEESRKILIKQDWTELKVDPITQTSDLTYEQLNGIGETAEKYVADFDQLLADHPCDRAVFGIPENGTMEQKAAQIRKWINEAKKEWIKGLLLASVREQHPEILKLILASEREIEQTVLNCSFREAARIGSLNLVQQFLNSERKFDLTIAMVMARHYPEIQKAIKDSKRPLY
jgi:hypothetical protein